MNRKPRSSTAGVSALRRLALAGLLVCLAAGAAAAECLRFPADGERRFEISRNGEIVGSLVFNFSRRAGRFIVRSDVEIAVIRQGIPLYGYEQHAEEVWVAGRLQAFVSDTDDDGTLYLVRAERIGEIFSGRVNGRAFTVSGIIVPASFWHRDTPASQALWDGTDGRVKVITGQDRGRERLDIRGEAVETRHFSLAGQIRRDLWYDADCALVRMSYPGRDGSEFVAELQ